MDLQLDLGRLERESFLRRVEWHATLPSTNDRALALCGEDRLETPLLVIAREQTAGRGRGANRWWSSEGALTFSLILDPAADALDPGPRGAMPLPAAHWPRVALTAGLSLCEALRGLAPHVPAALKWPNDVLVCGRKAAGILVEVPPARGPGPRRLVLGMGINVNNSLSEAPPEIQAVGTSLRDATGLEFDPTGLLLAWLARFDENLTTLALDDLSLPRRWQELCALAGRSIQLSAGERLVSGMCRGIDADGSLIVDTPRGRERFYGGIVARVG